MFCSSLYIYVFYRINAYNSFMTLLKYVYAFWYVTTNYVKFTLQKKEYLSSLELIHVKIWLSHGHVNYPHILLLHSHF